MATNDELEEFLRGPVEAKPSTTPDPKDQRIAELEAELLEMARTQAAGLAREEKLFKELDAAKFKVECEASEHWRESEKRGELALRLASERDEARTELLAEIVAHEDTKHTMYAEHLATQTALIKERDEALAECETWKKRAERMGDRAEHAHETIQRLEAAAGRMREALGGLISRLVEVHSDPAYISVWQVSQLHVGPYQGPTYVDALDRAYQALAESDAGTRALAVIEAAREVDSDNYPGKDYSEALGRLSDALSNWDQGHSTRHGSDMSDAIPVREESGSESAKPGGILPCGKDSGGKGDGE